jgi:hypothetical protein
VARCDNAKNKVVITLADAAEVWFTPNAAESRKGAIVASAILAGPVRPNQSPNHDQRRGGFRLPFVTGQKPQDPTPFASGNTAPSCLTGWLLDEGLGGGPAFGASVAALLFPEYKEPSGIRRSPARVPDKSPAIETHCPPAVASLFAPTTRQAMRKKGQVREGHETLRPVPAVRYSGP